MNKLLVSLFCLASLSSAQSVTASISVTFPATVAMDLNTHWISEVNMPVGTLSMGIDANSSMVTLSQVPAAPVLGTTILIGSEPMVVTAATGGQLSVSRYPAVFSFIAGFPQLLQPPKTHAYGSTVYSLSYPDPWSMITSEALLPYAFNVVQALGPKSATFNFASSGTVVPIVTPQAQVRH